MPATRSGKGSKPKPNTTISKKSPKSCEEIVAQLVALGQTKKEALAMLGTWGELTNKPKPSKPKSKSVISKRGRKRNRDSKSESSESEVEIAKTPSPKRKKAKAKKSRRRSHSVSPSPRASAKRKTPPKFKLDLIYSGATKEDLREFVRLFRLRAKRSQLDEEDQRDELQVVLRGAAIRWWEQNSDSFDTTDKLLEGMIKHFACDTGRRDARRIALKNIRQGATEQLIEFNARFDEARVDTHWSSEDELACYFQGLQPHIFDKVVGAQIESLADAMKAAKRVSAQLASLPAAVQGRLIHPPPPPAPQSVPQMDAILARLDQIEASRASQLTNMQLGPQSRSRSKVTCYKCGKEGHKAVRCGLKCSGCNRMGHGESECYKKPQANQPHHAAPTQGPSTSGN